MTLWRYVAFDEYFDVKTSLIIESLWIFVTVSLLKDFTIVKYEIKIIIFFGESSYFLLLYYW